MLEMSSSGVGQPKQKSINVEVNLLTEWLLNRSRIREQTVRAVALLFSVILAAIVTLPALNKMQLDARGKVTRTAGQLAQLEAQIAALQKEERESRPRMDDEAMRTAVRRQARVFLGHAMYVLNATAAGIVFEFLSQDVVGGEATLRCRAEAEDAAVAEAFLERAGKGPNVIVSLLASERQSSTLGPGGVAFEYVKKVRVEP